MTDGLSSGYCPIILTEYRYQFHIVEELKDVISIYTVAIFTQDIAQTKQTIIPEMLDCKLYCAMLYIMVYALQSINMHS